MPASVVVGRGSWQLTHVGLSRGQLKVTPGFEEILTAKTVDREDEILDRDKGVGDLEEGY